VNATNISWLRYNNITAAILRRVLREPKRTQALNLREVARVKYELWGDGKPTSDGKQRIESVKGLLHES